MKTIDEDEEVDDKAIKNELLKRIIARLRINDRVKLFGGQMGTWYAETDGNETLESSWMISRSEATMTDANSPRRKDTAIFKVCPYTLISVHVNNPNGSNEELVTVNYLDRVRLQGGRTGVVRYVGPLDGMRGCNQGVHRFGTGPIQPPGKEYFTVHSNKSAFIDKSQIVANLGNSIAMGKDLTPPNPYNGELAQGKIVKTKYYEKVMSCCYQVWFYSLFFFVIVYKKKSVEEIGRKQDLVDELLLRDKAELTPFFV
ncbi:hypothetical protein RFI_39859 [Reticulomyxa filosa]|uniref:Uncharacterized protein n=1 Tax=Reticulomyxa filosa TaxID=46433 RepID=X6L869_RETFI|nr:hypothetical protein RFI_39859 [Reticulomyxa filosa]|eukprot:ETN97670.1 hypothetical protein RFI_39859 [Reticulomyxa filosa]